MPRLAVIAAVAVPVLALSGGAAYAWNQPGTADGSTYFTGVPDSGYNGNWAADHFLQADRVAADPSADSSCPLTAPNAYAVTDNDNGISQTVIGANSPGETSVPIARSVGVTMRGGFTGITFCESSTDPSSSGVPRHVNAQTAQGAVLASEIGTATWYQQYFPATSVLSNFNDPGWGWTYTLGQNPTCGPGWQKWVDASTVSQAQSGNIVVLACQHRHH
jgi:hypothetical protein